MDRKGYSHTVSIVLNCKHVVEIQTPAPFAGDEQYCRRCQAYKRVIETAPNYVASCSSGGCTFNRSAKASKDKAFILARKHVQVRSKHVVKVMNGLLCIGTVTNTDETLFVTGDERAVIMREGQKLLKEFGLRTSGER